MDIRDIRYFLKIAECSHLGRAAEGLGVTQPALSKCVARLEEGYGVRLFQRVGRGLVLTEAGQLLRDRFRLLDQDLFDIRREVSNLRSGISGVARMGCSASISSSFLPRICRRLREMAPDLHLEVRVAMDDTLRDALRAGTIDLTISPERSPENDEAIVSERLLSDTVVVVGRRGHPLSCRDATLEDLARSEWILPMPTVSTRAWIDRVFIAAGHGPLTAVVNAAPLVAAPYIMAETDLLSFMSRRTLRSSDILVEIAHHQTTLERHFNISHRARGFLSPAVRFLIALLNDEASR